MPEIFITDHRFPLPSHKNKLRPHLHRDNLQPVLYTFGRSNHSIASIAHTSDRMSSSRLTIQETIIRAEKARALEASFQTLHRVPQIQAFFPGLQLGSYFENPHPLTSNV